MGRRPRRLASSLFQVSAGLRHAPNQQLRRERERSLAKLLWSRRSQPRLSSKRTQWRLSRSQSERGFICLAYLNASVSQPWLHLVPSRTFLFPCRVLTVGHCGILTTKQEKKR